MYLVLLAVLLLPSLEVRSRSVSLMTAAHAHASMSLIRLETLMRGCSTYTITAYMALGCGLWLYCILESCQWGTVTALIGLEIAGSDGLRDVTGEHCFGTERSGPGLMAGWTRYLE